MKEILVLDILNKIDLPIQVLQKLSRLILKYNSRVKEKRKKNFLFFFSVSSNVQMF